jgi:hypothetical protein
MKEGLLHCFFVRVMHHCTEAILQVVKSSDKQQLLSQSNSTHGSSTLRVDANPAGAETHWTAVLKFLKRFKPA